MGTLLDGNPPQKVALFFAIDETGNSKWGKIKDQGWGSGMGSSSDLVPNC